ncbi:MAG: hypothetical protein ABSD62_12080 [Candidatus Limnocylindrales bacterium]
MNQQLLYAFLMAAGVTIVDWILGILVALKGGTFSVQKLPGQLVTMILPYLGGSGLLVLVQGWANQYVGSVAGGTAPAISLVTAYAALSAYALKVLADVWSKIVALTPTQTTPAPAAVLPVPMHPPVVPPAS